jgi:SAM-dependent methyltransferase
MYLIKKLISVTRQRGIGYLLKRIVAEIKPKRHKDYAYIRDLVRGKEGIEIGGPSDIFRYKGLLPLYRVIKNLDGCNFSSSTIWEGSIREEKTYKYYHNKIGYQYIHEAVDLHDIASDKYDFLISSNCLEHIANPIKAMLEWVRIIKPNAMILLILPNKDYCFDHNRTVTLYSHLKEDYDKNTGEDDLTHIDEIMAFHDFSMDVQAGTLEYFKARSLKNYENRTLHHHVFDLNVVRQMANFLKVGIIFESEGNNYIIIGEKK